ncbi:MAG: hypothetical protein PUD73_09530 [bacterium]|nr:hypothetical protein [bacterium]
MKRITALFLAAALCLCLVACRKAPEQNPKEIQTETTDIEKTEGMQQQSDGSAHSGNAEENGAAVSEMNYQDMTIYWAYGDREGTPAGMAPMVYADRQGTDEIYSSLSIAQSDSGYVVEMEIFRLGYFSGTAVEADGMLVYTDDLVDMKGTIRYDCDHTVFEVTESSSDLVEVGTTWVFPEVKEEF